LGLEGRPTAGPGVARLQVRVKMMQHWADFLDGLRDGAKVIPIHQNA